MSAAQYPLSVMSGAEWNILDATGRRVAICHGNDLQGDATTDDIALAHRLVNADREAERLRVAIGRLGAAKDARDSIDFWHIFDSVRRSIGETP